MKRASLGTLLPIVGLCSTLLVGCFAEAPAVPATPTTARTATALPPGSGLVVFFARNDDLWRADLQGTKQERLSEGMALKWYQGMGDWLLAARYRPPQVSPDGCWIALGDGSHLVLLDVARRTRRAVRESIAPVVEWAPDSHAFAYVASSLSGDQDDLYIYDVRDGTPQHLLRLKGRAAGIKHFVWSPDGQFLAFSCCLEYVEPYTITGRMAGKVQQYEFATGQVQMVGSIQLGVASSSALCWAADGQVITSTWGAARCSPQSPWPFGLSPDRGRLASLAPLSLATNGSWTASRLTVSAVSQDTIGVELWQREIQEPSLTTVFWSPDAQYLLVDDSEAHSPIWRFSADGSGDLEQVVEDGYLLGPVPQWQ